MILAIFGSRALHGRDVVAAIEEAVKKHKPTHIVTAGEVEGVCAVVRDTARVLAVPLKLHWLNNKRYAAGKYDHRSIDVLKECDRCLFIHDGKSQGTLNEIEVCRRFGKPYDYVEQHIESATALDLSALLTAMQEDQSNGLR
jgi:hypothetical protein